MRCATPRMSGKPSRMTWARTHRLASARRSDRLLVYRYPTAADTVAMAQQTKLKSYSWENMVDGSVLGRSSPWNGERGSQERRITQSAWLTALIHAFRAHLLSSPWTRCTRKAKTRVGWRAGLLTSRKESSAI